MGMGMGGPTPTERLDAMDGRMDGRHYGAPIMNSCVPTPALAACFVRSGVSICVEAFLLSFEVGGWRGGGGFAMLLYGHKTASLPFGGPVAKMAHFISKEAQLFFVSMRCHLQDLRSVHGVHAHLRTQICTIDTAATFLPLPTFCLPEHII